MRHIDLRQRRYVWAIVAWQAIDCGIIMNYQDPENFGVALLDESGGTITPRYVEFIDGKKAVQRSPAGTSVSW